MSINLMYGQTAESRKKNLEAIAKGRYEGEPFTSADIVIEGHAVEMQHASEAFSPEDPRAIDGALVLSMETLLETIILLNALSRSKALYCECDAAGRSWFDHEGNYFLRRDLDIS